jgi:branched-chain amino acid aminotransferase
MSPFTVDPEVLRRIRDFRLPETLGFGQCLGPVLFCARYRDGRWEHGRLLPYGPLPVDPAAKVLHFGQVVFEGLKAYRVNQDVPALFRPDMNQARFNASARRMALPEMPPELFHEGLLAVTGYSLPCIPREPRSSLYLRPLLFGDEPGLGLEPSSTATFLVIASPSGPLVPGALRVRVEREATRAAPGGTGAVKASGNYGAALRASAAAQAEGCQTLWLDARNGRYVEELSAMNFFAVIDGELHTPALTGTILPGVTRASLIELARALGFVVHERAIDVDELLRDIGSGRCTECFACGTAIVLASISEIVDGGRAFPLREPDGSIAAALRKALVDLQEGRAPDRFGWLRPVPAEYLYPGDEA